MHTRGLLLMLGEVQITYSSNSVAVEFTSRLQDAVISVKQTSNRSRVYLLGSTDLHFKARNQLSMQDHGVHTSALCVAYVYSQAVSGTHCTYP